MRLERVINAVTAWRIRTLLARKAPNDPAELLFSDPEPLVIYATKLPRTPKPRTLKGAALVVAILAGHRKRDPPPGHRWQSCFACQAYLAEIKKSGRPLLSPERG